MVGMIRNATKQLCCVVRCRLWFHPASTKRMLIYCYVIRSNLVFNSVVRWSFWMGMTRHVAAFGRGMRSESHLNGPCAVEGNPKASCREQFMLAPHRLSPWVSSWGTFKKATEQRWLTWDHLGLLMPLGRRSIRVGILLIWKLWQEDESVFAPRETSLRFQQPGWSCQ